MEILKGETYKNITNGDHFVIVQKVENKKVHYKRTVPVVVLMSSGFTEELEDFIKPTYVFKQIFRHV